ncbi:MAG: molybdopterin-dependent oxidoreductase [Coriobacteriales bacterium]|jgi:molybdopterin-containing oxidoreductase family molybdopterin binding subunit|nr:molybdopterin-dependent oxidoreductase [Coriobacteriales bacterium]
MNWKIPYADNRLLKPLKRTGERGEGKFEEISWDQALDEICAKIAETTEKYGSRANVVDMFYCGVPGNQGAIGHILGSRFLNIYGASGLEGLGVDYAVVQHEAIDEGMAYVGGRDNVMSASTCIFIWGGNPIGFTRAARTTRMFLDARERGAKIFHISNLYDNTSAKVDEWVPVKSGTDAALALGMDHVLVRDDLVNKEFLLAETAAAYLVRTDTGQYLRESDIQEGGSEARFALLDAKSGNVACVDRATSFPFDYGGIEPQLECTTTVNGIPCKSSYTLLLEQLEGFTPEWQEGITGVPAATCEHLAHEYAKRSPSLMCIGDGLRYGNATQAMRAIKLLTYLTGNHGQPNGGTIMAGAVEGCFWVNLDRNPMKFDPNLPTDLGDFVMFDQILESAKDPNAQQYKTLIVAEGNPLLNHPNKALWRDRILPLFDMVVAFEIRMTDTCRWADYVLPEATAYERYEVNTEVGNCITLCEPAIEPCGESRTVADIWNGIASRLGIGQYFDKTQEEWARISVDSQQVPLQAKITQSEDASRAGQVADVTYDRLAAAKILHTEAPDIPFDPYSMHGPNGTETGRIQFYSEIHVETGDQLARQQTTYVTDADLKKTYPFQFFIGRHKYFMQGQFTNVPELERLAHTQFGVAMNPVSAAEKGLRDGDAVEVFNERGTMRSVLHLREDVAPGIVHTWYSFDETYYPDTDCPQELAAPNNAPETETPMSVINGRRWDGIQAMFGMPRTTRFIAGDRAPEVIFDVVCDIRKAE